MFTAALCIISSHQKNKHPSATEWINTCGLSIEYHTAGSANDSLWVKSHYAHGQYGPWLHWHSNGRIQELPHRPPGLQTEILYYLDLYRKVCQPLPYNNEKEPATPTIYNKSSETQNG